MEFVHLPLAIARVLLPRGEARQQNGADIEGLVGVDHHAVGRNLDHLADARADHIFFGGADGVTGAQFPEVEVEHGSGGAFQLHGFRERNRGQHLSIFSDVDAAGKVDVRQVLTLLISGEPEPVVQVEIVARHCR
jgi:hypothetical protein